MNSRGLRTDNDGGVVPGIILIASLVFGGYIVFERPFDVGATYLWVIILALSAVGFLYVVWGFNEARKEAGMNAAVSWLFTELEENSQSSSTGSPSEKTPPTPERLLHCLPILAHTRVSSVEIHFLGCGST